MSVGKHELRIDDAVEHRVVLMQAGAVGGVALLIFTAGRIGRAAAPIVAPGTPTCCPAPRRWRWGSTSGTSPRRSSARCPRARRTTSSGSAAPAGHPSRSRTGRAHGPDAGGGCGLGTRRPPGPRPAPPPPPPGPLQPFINIYLQTIIPLAGRLISGDRYAYRYLPESTRHFHTPAEVEVIMQAAGLENTSYRRLMHRTVVILQGTKPGATPP